ncbi:response regulator [Paenibacillus thalictri]|uniref:Response regulator n=1 Tax=Paenibacillus thalictri TaxID=2527873 RepID=A0A4Q9DFB9_9BACL|nr:response regulator [Paenibacillus thalictri]TBL70546.1 response regulator [Paenibacillus thalictri]
MIKAVLIDDEEIALDVLDILLGEVGGVSVMGKFNQASEALRYLDELNPELIFIDIEMPGMNGLTAADKLLAKVPQSEVVFVTAYEEYAVRAFEASAFDYLLKPVSKDRLNKTLDRFRDRRLKRASSGRSAAQPVHNSAQPEKQPKACLQLHVLGSMELYDTEDRLMTWRTKKTKELFAYLWHHAGSPVYRHKLMDELWPNLPLDRAQSLLHTTLYQLRSMLKQAGFPDMIMFGDERYWMRTEQIESDAGRLSELLQREADQTVIEQMLKLYRGDYLEMESYLWSEHKRYQLLSAYLRSLGNWLPKADDIIKEAILRQFIKLEPGEVAHYNALLKVLEERGEMGAANRLRTQMKMWLTEDLGERDN